MLIPVLLCVLQGPADCDCPPGLRTCREFVDIDALSILKRGVRGYQASSFDRSGLNDDGISGVFSFRAIDPNHDFVLFSEEGPGVISRMHFAFLDTVFTGGPYDDYDLNFYFDREPVARLKMKVKDLVSGSIAPFAKPLVLDDVASPGGALSILPIPFRSHLKITANAPVHFYDWQFHRYDDPAGIASFDPLAAANYRFGAGLLEGVPHDPKPQRSDDEVRKTVFRVTPSSTTELLRADGPGEIRELRFKPSRALTRSELRDLSIRIAFDNSATPQVDAPFGLFFGNELGTACVEGLLFGHDLRGVYYCFFPMPFRAQVSCALVSRSSSVDLALDAAVRFSSRAPSEEFGTFHAEFRETLQPTPLADVVLLDRVGWGHYVGCSLTVGSAGQMGQRQPLTYLEGDEHIYVDDSLTPQYHGTGTEEFFNWGWYEVRTSRTFSLPMHGSPQRWIEGTNDYTAQYRTMHADYVPFYRSIRVGLEHGPHGEEPAEYRSVSFYYARDLPVLTSDDVFDVGSAVDETAHVYEAHATTRSFAVVDGFYEGDPAYTVAISDDVREESGPHSFRMSIEPENHGVLLRRRTDQRFYFQSADVEVDGNAVGRWSLIALNSWSAWRDEEFVIPERFTRGKSSLRITIVPIEPQWNAARYQTFSYRD